MLVFLGCSTQLTILPEIAQYPDPPQVLIRGKIIYEGNPEYLPGTAGEARDNVDARIHSSEVYLGRKPYQGGPRSSGV